MSHIVSFIRGGCYFWAVVIASLLGMVCVCLRLDAAENRLFDLAIKWENEI